MSEIQMHYLVTGRTGEYDDRRSWPVVVLPCLHQADEFAASAAAASRAMAEAWHNQHGTRNCMWLSEPTEFDPQHQAENYPADYCVTPVPVLATRSIDRGLQGHHLAILSEHAQMITRQQVRLGIKPPPHPSLSQADKLPSAFADALATALSAPN